MPIFRGKGRHLHLFRWWNIFTLFSKVKIGKVRKRHGFEDLANLWSTPTVWVPFVDFFQCDKPCDLRISRWDWFYHHNWNENIMNIGFSHDFNFTIENIVYSEFIADRNNSERSVFCLKNLKTDGRRFRAFFKVIKLESLIKVKKTVFLVMYNNFA